MSERFTPDKYLPDAILLAAGRGTRLAPLTDATPKPLVQVGGVAMVDRVITTLHREGIRRFAINTYHHADQIKAHLSAAASDWPDCRFRLSREADLLETGGGLKHALPLLETDPVLAVNTDSFWFSEADWPIGRMLETAESNPDAVVLLCADPARATGVPSGFDFRLNGNGRLGLGDGEPVFYAGVGLYPRRWLEDAPDGPFSLYELMQAAEKQGLLFGAMLKAEWHHVGDLEGLAEAEARLKEPMI